MFFFSNRKNYVEEQIEKYMEALNNCQKTFKEGMAYFLEKEMVDNKFLEYEQLIHKYEGIADDIRDNLEMRMYEESLIPETRGDVLAFVENLDYLPNSLESVIKFIDEVNLTFPKLDNKEMEFFKRKLFDLVNTVLDAYELAVESGGCFFDDIRKVREYSVAIDRKESEADKIETDLKRYVFREDGFTDMQRMLFHRLITKISDTADLAESFHRRIILLSFKNSY